MNAQHGGSRTTVLFTLGVAIGAGATYWFAQAARTPEISDAAVTDAAVTAAPVPTAINSVESESAPAGLDTENIQILEPGDTSIAELARELAVTDFDAAVEALRSISDPVAARQFAHAALEALSYDDAAVASLEAVLPTPAARALRITAIERQASVQPTRAFRSALPLDDPVRSAALRKIAAIWSTLDPDSAMRAMHDVPYNLRSDYARAVLTTWAANDPQGVARHLETAEMTPEMLDIMFALRDVIATYPESERRIAERLPQTYRRAFDPSSVPFRR